MPEHNHTPCDCPACVVNLVTNVLNHTGLLLLWILCVYLPEHAFSPQQPDERSGDPTFCRAARDLHTMTRPPTCTCQALAASPLPMPLQRKHKVSSSASQVPFCTASNLPLGTWKMCTFPIILFPRPYAFDDRPNQPTISWSRC